MNSCKYPAKYICWKIPKFFDLPTEQGYALNSSSFCIFGAAANKWHLQILPNDTIDSSELFVILCLIKETTSAEYRVAFKMGITYVGDNDVKSDERNEKFGMDRDWWGSVLIKRSTLWSSIDAVAPDGTLTVYCIATIVDKPELFPSMEAATRITVTTLTPFSPTSSSVTNLTQFSPTPLSVKRIEDISDPGSKGLRGIVNMGNTCYMNVILQSLLHVPVIKDYLDKHSEMCTVQYLSSSSTRNDLTVCFSCQLDKIVKEFYSETDEVYVPHELLYLFWKSVPHFISSGMQDAHEFLMTLLQLLHKHCEESSGDDKYIPKLHANCIVEEFFTGVSQLDITCQRCKTTTSRSHSFTSLIIDYNSDKSKIWKLQDSIRRLTEPQQDSCRRTCDICEKQQMCTERTKFSRLPVILIFHVNGIIEHKDKSRYYSEFVYYSEIMHFPEDLDMTPFVSSNDCDSKHINCNKFHLIAAVHFNRHHYECYVKMHDKKWYHCSDTNIVLKPFKDIKELPMCLLFYQRTM